MSRQLKRRLGLTFLVSGLLYAGFWIPHPLVDPSAVDEVLGPYVYFDAAASGPLAAGPVPFLASFVLIEIVAVLRPSWRRRRLTDPALRVRLWRLSLIVGVIWAVARGAAGALQLANADAFLDTWSSRSLLLMEPSWRFYLLTTVSSAAGACCFALGAWLVDRFGVGRGFGVMLILYILAPVPAGAAGLLKNLDAGVVLAHEAVGMVAVMVGLWVALSFSFRAAQRRFAGLPLRPPTCGSVPLEAPVFLAAVSGTLAITSDFFWQVGQALWTDPDRLLLVEVALVVLLVVPVSRWFYWRRRHRLREGRLRRHWLGAMAVSALFLIALAISDYLVWDWFYGAALYWPGAVTLLVLWALAEDFREELKVRRALATEGEPVVVEVHQDVADALEAVQEIPESRRPRLLGLRYRTLTYFFGPFVPLIIVASPERQESPDPTQMEQMDADEGK